MKFIADDLLTKSSIAIIDDRSKQLSALKLSQLRENLSFFRYLRQSTWLTNIRNGINYDHKWATWWPYANRPKYYEKLRGSSGSWRGEASNIELQAFGDEDLLRFQATCNFIMAMCLENLIDMAARCSSGSSFHNFGTLAYMRQAKSSEQSKAPPDGGVFVARSDESPLFTCYLATGPLNRGGRPNIHEPRNCVLGSRWLRRLRSHGRPTSKLQLSRPSCSCGPMCSPISVVPLVRAILLRLFQTVPGDHTWLPH